MTSYGKETPFDDERYQEMHARQIQALKRFGQHMARLRLEKNWSYEQLFDSIPWPDFPNWCLEYFEKGHHPALKLVDAAQIAWALGQPLAAFLEGGDVEP